MIQDLIKFYLLKKFPKKKKKVLSFNIFQKLFWSRRDHKIASSFLAATGMN